MATRQRSSGYPAEGSVPSRPRCSLLEIVFLFKKLITVCLLVLNPEKLFPSREFEHAWDPLGEKKRSLLDNSCCLSPVEDGTSSRVERISSLKWVRGAQLSSEGNSVPASIVLSNRSLTVMRCFNAPDIPPLPSDYPSIPAHFPEEHRCPSQAHNPLPIWQATPRHSVLPEEWSSPVPC